jgi:hypothetical protein
MRKYEVKRVIIIIAIFWNADWWNACKCYWSVFGFVNFILNVLKLWNNRIYFVSIFSDLETEIQQKNLEKDLHLTNEKICELNNAIGVSNIRWDKSVCKTKTKKQVEGVIIIIAIFWNADWWNACKCYWSVFGFVNFILNVLKPKMKVVFTGGLCNFTQKITHDFGTETKYQNDPKANKVNSVMFTYFLIC